MPEFGRIPIVVVEVDQEICSRTYGSSPCTAAIGVSGTRKCFNTIATCQDRANYNASTLTLRFGKANSDLPVDMNIIPSVSGYKTSPTRINVGGRLGRDKSMGLRAEATITFYDHPHSDNLVDPYIADRTYNPLERGTFWSKWLIRNPYHVGWAVRVYEGYSGQALASMQTRHFIIDKIEGPDSNNNVTMKCSDVLRLVDNDKAQYPALTTGRLLAGITDTDTALSIYGSLETEYTQYPGSLIRIGSEIIQFTSAVTDSSGYIDLSGLTRGMYGTTASAHDADETIQACAEFINNDPWEIAKDLLIFGGVPSGYIPYYDWLAEATTWLGGLVVSNVLSQPKGIAEIIGELCEQCSFYIWWDEIDVEVKFKAIAPASGTVPLITESGHLIQGETKVKVRPELRASAIWVSYDQKNYTGSVTDRANFKKTNARYDTENYYDEFRLYEVYSAWLKSDAQVDLLTFRLLARYNDPPKYINFSLDPKDRSLRTGDVFDIEYRGFTDDTGEIQRVRYQVISSHEYPPGEKIVFEAQKFDYDIGFKSGYWMIDAAPIYSLATTAEKAAGCWWAYDDGTLPGGDSGYVWS